MTCPECEDGSCECAAGCANCEGTGVCAWCHGLTVQEVTPERRRTAETGYVWCTTCNRHTRAHQAQPDYEDLRTARPGKYQRMMNIPRCKACHAPFQTAGNRSYAYRLSEAS